MPNYPKSRPNVPFNGVTATRYDNEYTLNKVTFTILGDSDLWVHFCCARKPKKLRLDFFVDNFASYTAIEIIQNINDFNAVPGTKTSGDWGRHFNDGILEIYRALGLAFGWQTALSRLWRGKVL
jgi:hypothetical protein